MALYVLLGKRMEQRIIMGIFAKSAADMLIPAAAVYKKTKSEQSGEIPF